MYRAEDIESVTVNGITAHVKKITDGAVYGSDVIIEFWDTAGNYRNYHSDIDGGTVTFKDGRRIRYESPEVYRELSRDN